MPTNAKMFSNWKLSFQFDDLCVVLENLVLSKFTKIGTKKIGTRFPEKKLESLYYYVVDQPCCWEKINK
jgi:hypothetical protein